MLLKPGQFEYPEAVPEHAIPLYIHIPFCESLCPFCSFHRIKINTSLATNYFQTLSTEVDRLHNLGFRFNQVYVGGGTPTTMPNELVALLGKVSTCWPITDITVETNPNHLVGEILEPLKAVGVTRLSVGVQSLQDETLMRIGRYDAYGSRDNIIQKLANTQGQFETFNIDMIFNLPQQSENEIISDIAELKGLAVDQISYYPLMPALANSHNQTDDFTEISFRHEKYLYDLIVEQLSPDFHMGSAWCFNRKKQLGDEYIVSSDQYLGIGSGSFSLLGNHLYATTFNISRYIRQINKAGAPWHARQVLSGWQLRQYTLLTRLFGLTMPVDTPGMPQLSLKAMVWNGAIEKEHGLYQLTKKGRYYWLIMMREFFMGVNRYRRQLREHN